MISRHYMASNVSKQLVVFVDRVVGLTEELTKAGTCLQ